MADTISRDDYVLGEHLGSAGPATALGEATIERWRAEHPDWQGKHWTYTDPDNLGARFLTPINITPRPKNKD
ncbi:hypothetical protein BJY24_005686 [Nocardia transvalensis]|uniref:Uncharacterized protein n=1 Tax=Nocardia transvalensis TaxID=37333 RepID=A0A7W9UKR6_9NOCA|nr:hypothetical protein [Nocardia transvalensis]MBB5916774.1 hypothetical protein [Nocardia transvalensis]